MAISTSVLYVASAFFYLTTGEHSVAAAWGVIAVYLFQVGNALMRMSR